MSDVYRRIVTTFQARPGNVRAVMGDIRGSMGMLRRETREFANEQSYLNRQMRAFGTTARYAIAGGAIFGAVGGVSQLSQIQQQLGLISAIGDVTTPEGRSLALVGSTLQGVGDEIQQASIRTLQPLDQMNSAVVNFLSTVQNVKRPELIPMVEEISKGATLAQISVEEATKAFTTMNTAFGRPTTQSNIEGMSRQFFALTKLAPGGPQAGQQVVNQLGQIAQIYAAGRGTSPMMFGHLLGVLRGGIPPAQSGRGLAFTMQTLMFPSQQVAESQKALAAAGITPDTVQTLGPQGALMAVFREARRRGLRGSRGSFRRAAALSDEEFSEAQAGGPLGRELGIGGPGLEYLGTVFRRIHALRTALALFSRMDPPQGTPSLAQDLETMLQAQNNMLEGSANLAQAWKRFRNEAQLAQAARAVESMRLDIMQAFEPALNWAARRTVGAQGFVSEHNREVAFGLAGGLTAWGVLSKLRGRRSGIGRGIVQAQAAQDLLSGGARGETPSNPIWVSVVGQIFGGGRGPVPTPVPGGPANTPGNRPVPGGRRAGGLRGAARGLTRGAGRLFWPSAAVIGATQLGDWGFGSEGAIIETGGQFRMKGNAGAVTAAQRRQSREILKDVLEGSISQATAEKRLRGLIEPQRQQQTQVRGKVDVDVTVKDPSGKTKGTAKVSADLFPQFRPVAPQTRGKDKTNRGDGR